MENEITPKMIEAMALESRVTLTAVLKQAGVSRGSFYRWRRGEGGVLPLTKARLVDAAHALRSASRDRAA